MTLTIAEYHLQKIFILIIKQPVYWKLDHLLSFKIIINRSIFQIIFKVIIFIIIQYRPLGLLFLRRVTHWINLDSRLWTVLIQHNHYIYGKIERLMLCNYLVIIFKLVRIWKYMTVYERLLFLLHTFKRLAL